MSKDRLQKLIAEAGICSRRKAETMIEEGRVRVNGRVVTELGTKADPQFDKVEVDNKQLEFPRKVYLLLNKPPEMITSHNDEENRPVVYDLISDNRRLVSVGRLDYHTEGALILTNDGELVHRLTHPSSQVPREYEVKVKGELDGRQLAAIRNGVLLEDGPAQPVMVEKLANTEKNTWYSFVLTEGRNREVRRIVEAVGSTVLKLRRTTFAGLGIDNLPVGEARPLTPVEIVALYEQAGMLDEGLNSTRRKPRKSSPPDDKASFGEVPLPGKRGKARRGAQKPAGTHKGGRGGKKADNPKAGGRKKSESIPARGRGGKPGEGPKGGRGKRDDAPRGRGGKPGEGPKGGRGKRDDAPRGRGGKPGAPRRKSPKKK